MDYGALLLPRVIEKIDIKLIIAQLRGLDKLQ